MCSRPGDLSIVIPIFWMQESHKGGRTWESWILIGDWEIIGNKSGGQVQCIFIFNFRGWQSHPCFCFVAVLFLSYPQYWSLFCCCFTLMSPKLHYHWAAGDLFLCLWNYFVGTMNQGSCINRHFCILDVAEIESFICCLFSCVRGGHDATWLLIAIKTRFH